MIPWEVLTDKRLSPRDLRVYAVLAACRRGAKSSVGGRRLAQKACVARQRVRESLLRLQQLGLLELVRSNKSGTRAHYRLTSPLFAAKPGAEPVSEPPAAGSRRGQSRVAALRCAKCRREVGGLARTGWCRTCTNDAKLTRKIDGQIETTGRRVVREEIASVRTA